MITHKRLLTAALAVLAWGSAAPARAETVVAASLEWLTCSADVVVVGQVEKVTLTRGPGDAVYHDCTVKVAEVLKGTVAGGELVFCLRTLHADPAPAAWLTARDGCLFFLSRSKDHGPEKRLEGMLVPTRHQLPVSVFDLGNPGKLALDRAAKQLTGKQAILDTCRAAAKALAEHVKQNPEAAVGATRVEVEPGNPAWQALYAGSAVYLLVPEFLTRKGAK